MCLKGKAAIYIFGAGLLAVISLLSVTVTMPVTVTVSGTMSWTISVPAHTWSLLQYDKQELGPHLSQLLYGRWAAVRRHSIRTPQLYSVSP